MAHKIPTASGTNMDPPSLTQMPFRFFDLPRELRDMIYGNVTRDVHFPALGHRSVHFVRVNCTNYRSTQPLLVSHRFRDEYEETMAKGESQELEVSIPVQLFAFTPAKLGYLPNSVRNGLTKVKPMHLCLGPPKLGRRHVTPTGQWSMANDYLCNLLPFLPSLEKAVVRLRCPYQRLQSHIYLGGDFEEFTAPVLRKQLFAAKPEVEVKVVLILYGPMWHTWMHHGTFAARRARRKKDSHPMNEVTFEGRFSSGRYTWHGLDLTVPAGQKQKDFEEVLASIAAEEARSAEI